MQAFELEVGGFVFFDGYFGRFFDDVFEGVGQLNLGIEEGDGDGGGEFGAPFYPFGSKVGDEALFFFGNVDKTDQVVFGYIFHKLTNIRVCLVFCQWVE